MPNMLKLGEFFDLYSLPMNFTYQSKSYFTSKWGALISFIIYLLLIIVFYYLLRDVLDKNQFTFKNLKTLNDIPKSIKILKQNFNETSIADIESPFQNQSFLTYLPIAIVFKKNDIMIPLDESYIKLKISQRKYENKTKYTSLLTYVQCPGFLDEEQFEKYGLKNGYCLNDAFDLNAYPGFEGSKWLEIKVSKCVGSRNCKSLDQINQFLKNFKIEFYYCSKAYNLTNNDKIIHRSVLSTYWDVIDSDTSFSFLELGMDEFINLSNFMPNYIYAESTHLYSVNLKKFDNKIRELDRESNVLNLVILSSRERTVTIRSYKDSLSAVAYVGGIAIFLFSLGIIVVKRIAVLSLSESLLNKYFCIIDPNNKNYVSKSFEDFLKDHYNQLSKIYFTHSLDQTIENKIEENNKFDYTFLLEEKEIENKFRVSDDEGLSEHLNDPRAIHLYFTMKRIESLFKVTKYERDFIMKQYRDQNTEENNLMIDFYAKILQDKEKSDTFEIEKIVYNAFLLTCYGKMYLSTKEFLYYIFCRIFTKKNNEKVNFSKNLEKRFISKRPSIIKDNSRDTSNIDKKIEIFEEAKIKSSLDYDFLTIVNTVENFHRLTSICFDEASNNLFRYVSNSHIKSQADETFNKKKIFTNIQKDKYNLFHFNHALMLIFVRGNITLMEKRMLNHIGITSDKIEELLNAINDKKNFKRYLILKILIGIILLTVIQNYLKYLMKIFLDLESLLVTKKLNNYKILIHKKFKILSRIIVNYY